MSKGGIIIYLEVIKNGKISPAELIVWKGELMELQLFELGEFSTFDKIICKHPCGEFEAEIIIAHSNSLYLYIPVFDDKLHKRKEPRIELNGLQGNIQNFNPKNEHDDIISSISVINLSLGGLAFLSQDKIVTQRIYVVSFNFENHHFSFVGTLKYAIPSEEGIRYGVEFIESKKGEKFNQFQEKLFEEQVKQVCSNS